MDDAEKRQAIGSWLSGPRSAAEDMGVDFGYRGQRLGMPETGPGSVAPVGRRIAALVVDWLLCQLIAYGLFAGGDSRSLGLWTMVVFFVMTVLLVGTLGFTPGKRIMRIRVVAESGARLGFVGTIVRSVLLCLLIPAVVFDRDTRGLHDRVARAVEVRF
ncbi:RDD family protein [Streptomyces sp. CMB-StM0423]|uniref:RDD family protein n=1 Tax=Streptomyces sp. CMB-StM0423 TaxID=2059884 RepID=UPI000C706962|nr:RDD family protein [Streptomyces sp. CMB-StM0423]AUH43415.1 RDD family protein [Streptomyces sp. CMB-StM0423]